MNITKSDVSKIVDRLENKGHVLRGQSSVDGGLCCVAITDKGIEAITEIVELYTDYVSEMLKDFEPNTINNAKNVL